MEKQMHTHLGAEAEHCHHEEEEHGPERRDRHRGEALRVDDEHETRA